MKDGENSYCGPVGCNAVWCGGTFHGSKVSHFGLLGLVWHSLLNGYPSISNEPLLCGDLYDSWYENNASYFFFLMLSWMEFLALSTGYRHCPAPLGSSVLQSVTCSQHSSSAKSQKLWTCTLRQRLRTKFFNAEGFSLTQFHRHLRSEDIIDVSSVIHWIHCSNSSEETLVTGPTVLQRSFTIQAYSILCRGGKCTDNEGDFVEKSSKLCKGCMHDICTFYYKC